MNILDQASLSAYSTMGLGGTAAHLCEVTSRMEVLGALSWAQERQLPVVMIGGGSNIIWSDEGFSGLVIINKVLGYQAFEEDETNVYLTIGAGENWDSVVERSVAAGLTGIEALSLVPGSAGGTPVQNVGAYGQEIAQTLTTVEAFDTQVGDFVTLPGSDCGFSYRSSRFKTTDRGRFFITSLTLHLMKGNPQPPFYGALQTYFEANGINEYTPASVRQAVISIRNSKLPDPAIVKNTGSFFANPIITEDQFAPLAQAYDPIPHWPTDSGIKLSAAWLIEQAGFKDFHDPETGMATWPKQSLVLVNEHAKSTADLLAFKQKIVDAVQAKFNLTLEQEPELL
ncbi:MAG TPA: UDP-N-acetylmuramate dehydrogenase [Methylomirabilota bacterium]|nr:UDP-N-acetylmuramate dehydrogenase [Methylomirabilota bacterium]